MDFLNKLIKKLTANFPATNSNPVIPRIINPLPSKIIPPETDELNIVIIPITDSLTVINTPAKTKLKEAKIRDIQTIKNEKVIAIAAIVRWIPIGAAKIQRIAIKKVLEILFSQK